jgi:hypothetical protein
VRGARCRARGEEDFAHPAYLRATTDLDREELAVRAAIAIGWGVKSGGERMAVGPGGAGRIPLGARH